MTAYDSDIASVAVLLADRGRAAMLVSLLDGRPLSAGELAHVAGVTPQTASAHLAKLLDKDLVTVVRQGRHRYYRLSGPEVAEVLEALTRISPVVEVRTLRQSRTAQALQAARTCYDHLAGRAGVALLEAMLDRGLLEPAPEKQEEYELTEKGAASLTDLGLDLQELRKSRRRFAGRCLDWTERRPHLNGALAAAITIRLIELGWFERGRERRSLVLTSKGRTGLQDSFGCMVGDTQPGDGATLVG